MLKTHSRDWFVKQVDAVKRDVAEWPQWMKEGRTVATASFPKVGENKLADRAAQQQPATRLRKSA